MSETQAYAFVNNSLASRLSQPRSSGLLPMTFSAAISFLLIVGALYSPVRAQSATPSPESEEITRLREQKTRAELEKDIAVAEKAKLDAQFPKPSTSPLSGETKVDGATIESDMVSFVSMANAAIKVVKALKDSNQPIRNLAIYSKPDIDLLLNYKVTKNQLEIVQKQYCNLLKQDQRCREARELELVRSRERFGNRAFKSNDLETSSAESRASFMAPIGSFLGAFVDMTALLRTNVTVNGHTLDIAESALVSEIFRAIRSRDGLNGDPELFYPAAFSPNIDPNTPSAILGQLQVLYELKARATALFQGLEDNLKKIKKTAAKVEELEAGIAEIKLEQTKRQNELSSLVQSQRVYGRRTPFAAHERIQELRQITADLSRDLYRAQKDLDAKKNDVQSLETNQTRLLSQLAIDLKIADVEETLTRLKLMNDRFDQFVANLVKVDAATGINSLTALIKAENLSQALNNSNGEGYWLQVAVVKAGGNNRIKTNLVTDIFTGGSRISHSGGVVVQYNLYDQRGKSLVSDTLTEYGGYVKSKKIKQLPNPGTREDEEGDQAKRKTGPRDTRVASRN